ncbi:DUF1045 domain-containing protein [Paraburkholderia aspalathi]|nr:DUF1045 domain-containing protein [Paraburkholderia aspalathi]
MSSEPRYAIYYTPPAEDELTQTAARWLGRDAFRSDSPDALIERDTEVGAITTAPRRYGFHATLKAPFRLAAGRNVAELEEALARFVEVNEPCQLGEFKVDVMDGFFALVPIRPSPMLQSLASMIVDEFEPFRAPLTESELQRRLSNGLDTIGAAYTSGWGYPYVFDRFRFHMTLTDRLPVADQAKIRLRLEAIFSALATRGYTLDALTLFEQAQSGADFVVRSRFAFKECTAT